MDNEMKNQKLSDFFNLHPLNMTKQLESYKEEDALYKTTIPMHNPNYIFGLEIEAENITQVGKSKYKSYWDITGDNSLRNSGIEFVSKPLKAFQLEYAIDQLHDQLSKYPAPEFSPRTSTHVHMNVRDLTVNQIFNLVLIYTSVENVLFNWVGHNRDKNIFCIKLTDTDYVTKYQDLINYTVDTTHYWNKYTALNLKPMESKGTVEFRHMYGTWDKETILLWINFLSCIKTYARNKTTQDLYKEIQELNTNSFYEEYLFNIFGKYTKFLTQEIGNLQDLLEDSITYVKLSTLVKKKERIVATRPRIDWNALRPQLEEEQVVQEAEGQAIPTTEPQRLTDEQVREVYRRYTNITTPITNTTTTTTDATQRLFADLILTQIERQQRVEQDRLDLNNRTRTPTPNRPLTIEERARQRAAARNNIHNQQER